MRRVPFLGEIFMRKAWVLLALLLALGAFCLSAASAEQTSGIPADTGDAGKAEWTVMIYMCGSDLESKYCYATGNLEEILNCQRPYSMTIQLASYYGYEVTPDMLPDRGKVNVTIETGGCRNWHTDRMGFDVSHKKLQRWTFEPLREDGSGGYQLEEELPLQSMAEPETLTDFIVWSAEKYPAKKYALVLWDHGGGSKTGIFIDELFNNEMMYLYELGDALKESGIQMETVLFDACLMASVETAFVISNYAKYMVASEEVVAGQGTAIGDWLQELYFAPTSDGKRLGRLICDTTQIKFANLEDTQAGEMLAWSVIDLSQIQRLGGCIDRLYKIVGMAYKEYPELMRVYAFQVINNERYGNRSDSMFDLASLFYSAGLYQMLDPNIRQDVLEAIEDAVVYTARGSDHFGARGLSFCYAAMLTPEEMDIYAKNCPSPSYLALADAVSPWSAPDWVYERTEKLPEIDELDAYRIGIEKKICADGTPGINLAEGTRNVSLLLYKWYQKDEDTGELVDLGVMLAEQGETKDGEFLYRAFEPWKWPSVEGTPCCFMLNSFYPGGTSLCEVPIKVGADVWKLRIGMKENNEYEIYGVWDGSEYVGQRFTRNMKTLAQMVGQNYQLLYPVVDAEEAYFHIGKEKPFLRTLRISTTQLPPGTYYLEYVVMDMFQRTIPMDRIELNWDGEQLTMAEGTEWDGTVYLKWDGKPVM